jgi:antitoxin (DNA-binding transcriptional repressor) of toxin-antitoxin stability system
MQTVSIAEFKTNLSKIINEIEQKKKNYILEYGRGHKKVAVLMPFEEAIKKLGKREFGQLEGKKKIPENFDDENIDINSMFYGSDF